MRHVPLVPASHQSQEVREMRLAVHRLAISLSQKVLTHRDDTTGFGESDLIIEPAAITPVQELVIQLSPRDPVDFSQAFVITFKKA